MTALRGGWGRSREGVPANLSSARPPPHHGSKPPYLGKSSDPQFLNLLHTHAPLPSACVAAGHREGGPGRVPRGLPLCSEPRLPHPTAKRLACRTPRRTPARDSHTRSCFGGRDSPPLPIPLMSSVAGNGQGAAAEGREGQKGRRRKRKPVSVCAAGVGEPASQSHRPGRVGPELPRSLHAAALRPAPDVVRWVSEVPSAPASCVLAQVRRALCRALQPDPGGDCGMNPPARLQAHGVQRGHPSALDRQPPGPTSLQREATSSSPDARGSPDIPKQRTPFLPRTLGNGRPG